MTLYVYDLALTGGHGLWRDGGLRPPDLVVIFATVYLWLTRRALESVT